MKTSFMQGPQRGRSLFARICLGVLVSACICGMLPAAAQDILPVRAAYADSTIAPFKRMTLTLQGPPGETVSVAVCDGDVQTNACRENAATYLLLSSELKGYVRDAAYYLEADDAEHRVAADLLCLTQGWTRYDWEMMAGQRPFVKRQPLEDGLYLDGRVYPRQLYGGGALSTKKKRAAATDVSNIHLKSFLYNRSGEVLRGEFTTDAEGYYAFAMPPCEGEWTLILTTEKDDGKQNYRVGINRHFTPERKTYDFGETHLVPLDTAVGTAPMAYNAEDYEAAQEYREVSTTLDEAVVKVRRSPLANPHTRRDWQVTRKGAERRSQFYFNIDDELEKLYDQGKEIPTLCQWLLSKPAFARAYFDDLRDVQWIKDKSKALEFAPQSINFIPCDYLIDSLESVYVTLEHNFTKYTSQLQPEPKAKGSTIQFLMQQDEKNSSGIFDAPDRVNETPPTEDTQDKIDENVSFRTNGPMRPYTEGVLHDPFHVFVYPRNMYPVKARGVRNTFYRGYNVSHGYEMPDYTDGPREADFRRTLLWAPDLSFDSHGRATVEFYNSMSCLRPALSVEGVSAAGQPVVEM